MPVLLIFPLLFACKTKPKEGQALSPAEIAKRITAVTSGLISSGTPILVRFSEPVVKKEQTGTSLKKTVFSFEPNAEGSAYWQNSQTLIFKPSRPWPIRQKYKAALNIKALFPALKAEQALFPFSFRIAGREVKNFSADFAKVQPDKTESLILKGTISFTESTNLKAVQKAAFLETGGKRLALKWNQEQQVFHFQSIPIKRGKTKKNINFIIKKDPLQLSVNFQRSFNLPSLHALTLSNIITASQEEKPQLTLEFSDQLDSRQNLAGLIRVEPQVKIRLRTLGKKVFIKGPFRYGKTYRLILQPGIRSRWGSTLKTKLEKKVPFEDMLPQIRFSNSGVFLPSSNRKTILFQSVNVRKVHLEALKVFESNLGQFLQTEKLDGRKERSRNFSYNINRVGISVVKKDLAIGNVRNRWLQNALDLNKLIPVQKAGLYLLRLTFERKDMLYDISENNLRYTRRRYNYYNDPSSYGYIYSHGRIYKPVILSDIGLTYIRGQSRHYVFANNLLNAKPLSGVHVQLRSYQNQLLAEGRTGPKGMVEFDGVKEKVFYVQGSKSGQRSIVKPSEMAWNLSTFDTRGAEIREGGLRGFIYTERGIYRPGDAVNCCFIVRNAQQTFPENHPVSLNIRNPLNQIVFQSAAHQAQDGFYRFRYQSGANDLTGNYTAEFKAGSQTFRHNIRIETIVPERLKVEIKTPLKHIKAGARTLPVTLSSKYLFGNPASGLESMLNVSVFPLPKKFKKYNRFIFENRARFYETINVRLFAGRLNRQGKAQINWTLPSFSDAPSALAARIEARVTERGGRPAKNFLLLSIDPYNYYVGIDKSALRYGSMALQKEIKLPVILLDSQGTEAPGRTLNYRIYHNEQHWWWEYSSSDRYRLRFKSDKNTKLIRKGTLISGRTPVLLSFTPQKQGKYLVEVQEDNGHTAAVFLQAYPWGASPSMQKNAGILTLQSDKKKYHPGEQAQISFPVPPQASVLMTIEKEKQILKSEWFSAQKDQRQMTLKVAVNKAMLPNAYVCVSVIQPQAQTENDRPIRMYGVLPLMVEEENTHQYLQLYLPRKLKPGRPFTVQVQTRDHQPTQLTIAVVDQGLLSLTRFRTPDPWQAFFGKQQLGMATFDLFSQVIGANRGDVFRTFSIGGGMTEEAYRTGQLVQQQVNRFKAVSLFKGPLQTDAKGHVSAHFKLPEYVGAVRIMAVSAKGARYGKAEKTVVVKSDLMLLPTLPRALGPGDRFRLPVVVFATNPQIKKVTLQAQIQGPLYIVSNPVLQVNFTEPGQQTVYFTLQAKEAAGKASVTFKAQSVNYRAHFQTKIAVRAASARVSESNTQVLGKGQTVGMLIPDKGLAGSNRATLSLQRRPNLKLKRRILWLIRYPYGCIEQSVSAALPQLYLLDFIPKTLMARHDIDQYINAAINRLNKFRMTDGGFSYWPGSDKQSDWGSIYAGYFMTEARNAGYHVPDELFKSWLNKMREQARMGLGDLMEQVYRVYVLTLAGKADIGSMNLLRENHLAQMSDVQRWLLAAAYKHAGIESIAATILAATGSKVTSYPVFSETFGSALRDKALMLEQMVYFEHWRQAAGLADELAGALSSQEWYSTQSTAYMLMALGKFFDANEAQNAIRQRMVGTIIWPDGQKESFDTDKINFQIPVHKYFGQQVKIHLSESSTLKRAYVTLEWSGLPLHNFGKAESKNLKLKVEWLNEDGMPLDPSKLKQGQIFWAHFRVSGPPHYNVKISHLALVQILPAGWEVETALAAAESQPAWMRKWHLDRETYKDFRDDRVMWFFDLPAYGSFFDFTVKLSVVGQGRFFLPPTLCEAMYNHNYRASGKGMVVETME